MQSGAFSSVREKVMGFTNERFAVLHRITGSSTNNAEVFLLPTISTVAQDQRFFVKPIEEELDKLTLDIIREFTTFEVNGDIYFTNPITHEKMILYYSPQLSYVRTNHIIEESFVKINARDGETLVTLSKGTGDKQGMILIEDIRGRVVSFPQKYIERYFLVQSIIDIALLYSCGYKTHNIHEDHYKKFAHSF